ncbi:tRNA-modifying protein ygfZ [Candidatus Johnevansia muelleri]|uniref:tRNA-modifying protein ygfZ n=1 Tax=Candidatus Johnevansia muelleri TaxID=1495769 RepID=A0A078KEW3_9GAMM|nr:tRNA-modifying protein ygfZ [Candidatus Evansia muelleri]
MKNFLTTSVIYLNNLAILEVVGIDSILLIQGQGSAQINHATEYFSPLCSFCTPLGKIIANSRLIRVNKYCYWILIHSTILKTLFIHLKKYTNFYKKVKINFRNDIYLLGIIDINRKYFKKKTNIKKLPFLPGELNIENNFYLIYHNGINRIIVITYKYNMKYLISKFSKLELKYWLLNDIQSGFIFLDITKSNMLLPQMINWETLGGISFKKGCYTGQEIIARVHYIVKFQKRLMRFYKENNSILYIKKYSVLLFSNTEYGIIELIGLIQNIKNIYLNNTINILSLPYDIKRLNPEELIIHI